MANHFNVQKADEIPSDDNNTRTNERQLLWKLFNNTTGCALHKVTAENMVIS